MTIGLVDGLQNRKTHFAYPFRQGVDLPDEFVNMMEAQLFRTLRIAGVGRWIGVGLGLLMFLAALAMYVMQRQSITITPSPTKEKNGRA